MKAQAIGKTTAALLAGVIASVVAVRWLDARASAQRHVQTESLSAVVVAAEDIAAGHVLGESQLRRVQWPSGMRPADTVGSTDELIGRVTRARLVAGEPVLATRLAPVGSRAGLSALIGPGKRAMTVSLSELGGLDADALDGARVDVIVNATEPGSGDRARSVSRVVLERIAVLGLSTSASGGARQHAVTLEVSPEQAETLDLARHVGRLSLVLRSQVDGDAAATRGATRDTLLGLAPGAPVAVPVPVASRATATRDPVRPVIARAGTASGTTVAPPMPVSAPLAPLARRTCVEALIGSDRRQECF